jgi:hypothetical protein
MQAMLFRLYNQRVFELSEQKSVQQLSNRLEEELSNFELVIITDNTRVTKNSSGSFESGSGVCFGTIFLSSFFFIFLVWYFSRK